MIKWAYMGLASLAAGAALAILMRTYMLVNEIHQASIVIIPAEEPVDERA